MSNDIAIRVEHVSKEYRLGMIGGTTLKADLQRLWAKMRGKEDPTSIIGSDQSRFGERFLALDDVSFEVKKGEALGIIGHNGAGKSTLLKLLARVTSPTKGTISYNGRIASMLEVGTGFHGELTGRENIYMNGAILGMRKAEIDKKLDEIIAFAEMEKFIDTPVKRYSSGMYVKLAFAVAAHLDAEIMIMDEVLAVGDMKFQQKCLGRMDTAANKEGRTILFVSHNMGAIKNLCSTAMLLNHGKIQMKSDVDHCLERYMQCLYQGKDVSLESMNREGNGLIKMTKVSLLNSLSGNDIFEGDPFGIIVQYKSQEEGKHPQILLSINNDFNGTVLFFDSTASDSVWVTKKGPGCLRLDLDNCFSLTSGSYYINIAIIVNGVYTDYIQRVISFRILSGDLYKTGRNPVSKGLVHIKHSWKF